MGVPAQDAFFYEAVRNIHEISLRAGTATMVERLVTDWVKVGTQGLTVAFHLRLDLLSTLYPRLRRSSSRARRPIGIRPS